MSQLIEVSVNVSKLDKKKFIVGKDGVTKYAKLTLSVNDDTDQFDQDVSVYEAQTKEEREAKTNKNFVGNGKTFWANGGAKTASEKGKKGGSAASTGKTAAPDLGDDDDDDLPF